ncbi:MAG: hypothetical protein NTY50_08805 [Methylobacter sp.]|nr:hypothetical protein [Methylobacter sp.]
MLDTSDFLQADDINKVMGVVDAIANGRHVDYEIEQYIGVDSKGRQGRYYRLAAEKFGLVNLSGTNYSTLTQRGAQFVNLDKEQRKHYIIERLHEMPPFSDALQLIQSSRPNRAELSQWFSGQYPGSEVTAERRFSTFLKYLSLCGYRY